MSGGNGFAWGYCGGSVFCHWGLGSIHAAPHICGPCVARLYVNRAGSSSSVALATPHGGLHRRFRALWQWRAEPESVLSRIIGLPANPRTARGYTGNITLDEFQSQEEVRQIDAAVFPLTTRGYQPEIIGTPLGQQGEFYELAQGLVVPKCSEARIEPTSYPELGSNLGSFRMRCFCPFVWSWSMLLAG